MADVAVRARAAFVGPVRRGVAGARPVDPGRWIRAGGRGGDRPRRPPARRRDRLRARGEELRCAQRRVLHRHRHGAGRPGGAAAGTGYRIPRRSPRAAGRRRRRQRPNARARRRTAARSGCGGSLGHGLHEAGVDRDARLLVARDGTVDRLPLVMAGNGAGCRDDRVWAPRWAAREPEPWRGRSPNSPMRG